jgi:multidrug resistance efflux pump
VLTGIVTTHDVAVAPQIGGRLVSLLVKEGDEVKKGQAIAEIDPGELRAERAYFEHSAEGIASQVRESEAALRLQERQLTDQIKQAEAAVATSEAQRSAAAAEVERAKVTVDRTRELFKQQLAPAQRWTKREPPTKPRWRAWSRRAQIDAARRPSTARSNCEQVSVRRSQCRPRSTSLPRSVAARARRRAARLRQCRGAHRRRRRRPAGARRRGREPGQTLLTLIDPDDLWVRADIEETYIDRVASATR